MIEKTIRRWQIGLLSCFVFLSVEAATGAQTDDSAQPQAEQPAEAPKADAPPPVVPPVHLSKEHEALCRVKVGDAMPGIKLSQIGGAPAPVELAKLYGKAATVVVFWSGNQRMTWALLADLGPDVIEPFGKQGVAVVGVAVGQAADAAKATLARAEARFTNLIDPDGKAFALVGKEKLPRVYLLDPEGKVLWFDIEYSLATRRELNQALRAVDAKQKVRQND